MPVTEHDAPPDEGVGVQFACLVGLADPAQVDGKVVGGRQRAGVVLAEDVLEAVVRPAVHFQRLGELAQAA